MTTEQTEFETIGITGEELHQTFHQALVAIDPKLTRYYLNRVRLEIDNNLLLVVGTDGKVLTRASARLVRIGGAEVDADKAQKVFGFSIHHDAARDLLAQFANVNESTHLVCLSTDGKTLKVSHGEQEYVTTELDDSYPDWRRLFPEYYAVASPDDAEDTRPEVKKQKRLHEYTTTLKISFDHLFEAVRGLKTSNREDWFSFVPGDGLLAVRIATKFQGDTVAMQENRIRCEFLKQREGDFVCFYNTQLLQVLKGIDKVGNNVSHLTISTGEELGPVKIYEHPLTDGGSIPTVHLVMPIRHDANNQGVVEQVEEAVAPDDKPF